MRAGETTMEARLAATTASLNHSLEWMKKISECSQSTEVTLAHISRMQASWAPMEMGARVATPTMPLSARPTMASLNVSPRREARMDELFRSIDASLAEIVRLQEVMERRQNSIVLTDVQVACVDQRALVGPIRADAELKGCLDMVCARRECTSVPAAPTTKSTTRFLYLQMMMANEDMCLATPRSVIMGAVVDPPSDMSATHQAFDEMPEGYKEKDGQSHAVLELFDEDPIESEQTCDPDQLQLLWCEESYNCEKETIVREESDDVLTHVGGSSLFLEFDMHTTDHVLDAQLLNDEQRSDAMFTQFAALHTQCHNQESKVPFFLVGFGTWAGGKLHHGSESVMVCDAEKGGHVTDIPMRPRDSSADSFYDTTKKKLKLAKSFAEQLDPGIVRNISIFCQLGTVRTQSVLPKLHPWRRSGFSPGHFEQPHSGRMPSWRHGSFSSSVHVSAFITGTRIFYSQFPIKGFLLKFSVIVSSALFFVTSRMEVNHDSLHIILARVDTCLVEQLALRECITYVVKVAVFIFLNLTLEDACCLIRKLFSCLVCLHDMTQKFYLGNNIQPYEGSVCMGAFESRGGNQPSFGMNSKYAVRLHGHLILSLVDEATAVTRAEQHFGHVIVQNQNVHWNVMTFELKVDASMQMYWRSDPGILSVISEGVTKPIAHGATATNCKGSRLERSLHNGASELAFVQVIWQYHIGQWDSFFQEEMVHRNQQEAGSGCYFHLLSRLFGFNINQLCDMSTHDGIPWDPGGIHTHDGIPWDPGGIHGNKI